MQLGNKGFSNYDIMNYTNDLFLQTFGNSLASVNFYYSENVMGSFKLTYKYLPRDYKIEFEYDRLYFEILIFRKEGEKSSTSLMNPSKNEEYLNLEKSKIKKEIKLLHEMLVNNKESFYTYKDNKLVKVD